jgi:hypothetical protein
VARRPHGLRLQADSDRLVDGRITKDRKGLIMATRAAYQQKLEAQLKEWDAKLDQLNAKAQKATADARIKYENELESLKGKRAEAHKMLVELGKRGENAWEDMKDGAERVWDEMGKAMEKIAARFK